MTVNNGEEIQDALINGSGFEDPGVGTPDSVHLGVAGEMWTAIGSIRAEAVFDLGKTVSLTKVYIWNYNAGADTDRGMKEVQVLVSPDTNPATAKFTGIGTATLTEGGDKAQVIAVVGTNVRLVKIKNDSNWGHGYAIGLAEVRFESGEITGNVPTIAISGLNNGDVVPFGSDISLSATVTDRDNDLAKVEFFDGATKLDEKTVAPFSTSLKSLAKGDHTLRVVATDKTGKSGWNTVTVAVREVVPGKVIKIDDNLNIGTNVNQIRYSGAWTLAQGNANDPRYLNNDHYADASGSYFEIKFFGVKIDVFATVASHHGTANATIDGGTRYTLNYKAAQRGEQAFIWSSPLLPNREHVLRIAVAGTGVVTADRFDVTQSDTPSADRATVKKWDTTLTGINFEFEDLGGSKVDTNTVTLKVDSATVAVKVSKTGAVTTVTYTPASPFQPGSQHPFKIEAKDTLGNGLGAEATFTVPSPPFPLSGLGEPAGAAGLWSVRQIWNAGRADAVVTAVGIANAATTNGFAGKVFDDKSPVINFVFTTSPGNAGLMPDDQPFPAETQGLVANDWVTIARGKVRIPRAGDWTIGVHTDDGFSLRFAGHPFASVSGNGSIDEDFPEYVSFAVGTGDSNTRAVLKNVPAGDYLVEFIHFQRVGGAAAEIYAAEGEFVEDGDTSWALIGAPDGLQLVADEVATQPPLLTRIQNQSGNVTIDFTSSRPVDRHELQESTDLKTWRAVGNAVFTVAAGNSARASVGNVTGAARFYRVMVKP